MSLGERVLDARVTRGLTQRKLALRADLTTDTISKIENGRGLRTGSETVAKLARALGCSSDWLLGISNHGPTPVNAPTDESGEKDAEAAQ